MTADVVAVSGTLIGVALGGFINFVANRSAKQREWRLGIDKELLFLRNRAYAEFLDEYLAQLAVMPRTDFPALEERLRLKSKLHAMAFLGSTKPVVVAENMIKRLHATL